MYSIMQIILNVLYCLLFFIFLKYSKYKFFNKKCNFYKIFNNFKNFYIHSKYKKQ